MFCFRVRRRLYDLSEGNLGGSVRKKVEAHLRICPNCDRRYRELKQLLNLASQSKTPEPSEEFWTMFDRELRGKLSKKEEFPREVKLHPIHSPRLNLRPAFALATVAVFLMAISFYLFGGLPTKGRLVALSDERLVNDIDMLEELAGESIAIEQEDFLLDELILLEEMG